MSTVNVQDELVNQMAMEIAAEIDFEVMASVMIKSGWHKVKLDRFKNNNHAVDVLYWIEENSTAGHFHRGSTYIFEKKGDAINFALKWA